MQPESSNHEITLIALTPPTVTDKSDNTKKDEVKQGFVELFYKETKKFKITELQHLFLLFRNSIGHILVIFLLTAHLKKAKTNQLLIIKPIGRGAFHLTPHLT